ncbi:transposase [Dehalococcoidia bacterium]|nr:transposase [Dehalococcoidia bacterium]
MIRAHKIRLNPTTEQEIYFKQAVGISRFVFNWGLARWKEQKANGVGRYGPAMIKAEFNALKRDQFPWTTNVTKNAVEDGFRRLGNALDNYFKSKDGKRAGERIGFPKFKSKKRSKQSFTLDYERFKVDGHQLFIQKLSSPVNMSEHLRFDDNPKWATISRVADKWYVSIVVEMEQPERTDVQGSVGVDVGVKMLVTLSDGTEFENQKLLRSEITRYRRLSRRLSRRRQGSNRWWTARKSLARFHERIANRRMDIIHKMTAEITRNYGLVVVEDLNIKDMSRNRKLALSIADAAVGEILRQLDYKSRQLIRVGRFYASSKICSECGHVNHSLMLSDRQWACIGCGALHNRDWNAAKNILQEGLRTFGSGYVEGMGRGQLVRPVFQAKLEEASTSTGAHFCALER